MTANISTRVREILEWPAILADLEGRCRTVPGKNHAVSISPMERGQVTEQLNRISDLKELRSRGESPDLSGITDIGPLVSRSIKGSVLSLEELTAVRDFTGASESVRKFLGTHRHEFQALASLYNSLDRLTHINSLLYESIDQKNELNTARYPGLKRIRNSIITTRQDIEKKLGSIINSPDMSAVLQERVFTGRNDRYVILVKAGMKGRIKGRVHDVSSSGSTLYIEPDSIVELNSRYVMLDRELQAEIARILRELTAAVSESSAELMFNLSVLACTDFLCGAADQSAALDANAPEIADTPVMQLIKARHPLLTLMGPGTVVPNNIELGVTFTSLVISGANTGGKTVLLKTIGLSALMILHGLHIPAGPDSRIGLFKNILADIGDDQNLSQSLSTFSGQMVIIREMLEQADQHSLVIIDEIVVGTNPRQGAALARAILESLVETGSRIVTTTHYAELKDLAARDSRFQNGSVSFDLDTLKPTYRLNIGLPGVSYATEIAKNYGIPEDIIIRSREMIDSMEISAEGLIESMQKFEQETREERLKLSQERESLSRERDKCAKKEMELVRKLGELRHREGIDFLEELKEYRKRISARITDLQQADMKEAGTLQEEIISMEKTITQELKKDPVVRFSDKYIPVDPENLAPGDRVLVLPLEKEGVIESVNPDRKKACVLFGGSIRSQADFNDLCLPRAGRATKKGPGGRGRTGSAPAEPDISGTAIPLTVQTSYNTIDLRGKRVEEALDLLDRELDRMTRSRIGSAVIIHGHGTGALKEAVRNNLVHSVYISDFRPGDYGEGGDGVTIAVLRD